MEAVWKTVWQFLNKLSIGLPFANDLSLNCPSKARVLMV